MWTHTRILREALQKEKKKEIQTLQVLRQQHKLFPGNTNIKWKQQNMAETRAPLLSVL